MFRRSQITLCRCFLEHPFQSSPIPSSAIFLRSLTKISRPTSQIPSFPCPTRSNPNIHPRIGESLRGYCSVDKNKEVDMINLKFAEAREEIELALESRETVYFDEEAECARTAVTEVLEMFESLLGKLPESEKGALRRSMGLKIEQLKAELQQLDE